MAEVPEEIMALVREREERRTVKDFSAADALRGRVHDAGYDIEDSSSGPTLRRVSPKAERITPGRVTSVLDQEPRFDVSVQWLVQGWADDVVRGIESFRGHAREQSVQHVVVDCADTTAERWPEDVEIVPLDRDPGWGAGRNAGLKRAAGRTVVVIDSSVEPSGDVLTPLLDALSDPSVGVVGPVGVVTEDLHHFHPSDGPEVDAVEAYLMAFRRDVLVKAGLFDEGFRFYRAADLEMSFRVRAMGLRALSVPVPVQRHEHRMWANTPEAERDRLSKRNYYRFLDRWRGRLDLCSGRRGHDHTSRR